MSLIFQGNTSSKIVVPYSPDLDFGVGDFTVEWYQYSVASPNNQCPTVFSRGDWFMSAANEPQTFLYWYNNYGTHQHFPLAKMDGWIHYAITRAQGTTQVFMNGTSQLSFADATDYTNVGVDLVIGNETMPSESDEASFNGYITYFALNKGYARYTRDFTVTRSYPPILPSTVLMVNAYANRGTLGQTVLNYNIGTLKPPPKPKTGPFYQMVRAVAR